MGKISSYGTASAPQLGDKLIGTSISGDPIDGTYNFTIQQLADLISGQITLQEVLTAGNTATSNINLTGIITTTTLNSGNITSSGIVTAANAVISGYLKDKNASVGLSGQVLSSTVTGTQWITLPSTPTLQQVLNAGNSAVKDVSIQGTLSIIGGVNANGFSLTNDDYFYVGEAGAIIGYSNDDERLTIKNIVSNGIALINNNSSLELLDNEISFNADGVLYFNILGSTKMKIDSSGKVLINTPTVISGSSAKLQVNGDLYVGGTGFIVATGGISTNATYIGDLTITDFSMGIGLGMVCSLGDEIIASWDYNDSGDYIYGNRALVVTNIGGVTMNNLPTSPFGLEAGGLWRNGNVVNIV